MSDWIGRTFGKYQIVAPLGRGGMAEVYKAYQANLDRHVALKLVLAHLAEADSDFITRFEREAKNIAALRHPNIVQVYDFDVQGDTPYMVMELIDGGTLKALLDGHFKRGERLTLTEALRLTRSIAEALAYAHKRGVVHRDVKPANVMLDVDGRVVLTDFGLAKVLTAPAQTATGQALGTPAYMAPEQGLGQTADHHVDMYSLGVMLFEMTTGRLPYQADSAIALILQHITAATPHPRAIQPDLPEALDRFIFRAIAKQPEDRFPDMEAFLMALLEVEGGHRITAPPFDNPPLVVATPQPTAAAPMGLTQFPPSPIGLTSPAPPEPTLPPDVAGLVGRQSELDALARQLEQTHLVILSGMPGIGKTTIAAALARQVAEPTRLFWHSFHAGEDVSTLLWKLSAFLAWRRRPEVWNMLDSARQTRGQSAPPEVILDYLFQLMRGQGHLLCFDDVHHIDDDPLFEQFLERLQTARRAGDISIILTSRHASRSLDADATTPLTGLSTADAERLLQARGLSLASDLLNTLHLHTEGNPQLLCLAIEAMRRARNAAHLLDDLLETPRIGDFLLKEVDKGLDDDEREVMKGVAALLGHPGTRRAIHAVLGDDTTVNVRRTLNDLVGRYLVMVFEGELGREYDEHVLVQAYYYDLLNKRERTEWHRRAAEYYESEAPDVLKAARHYQKAGQDDKAAGLAVADVWGQINQGQTRALRQILEGFTERKLTPPVWVNVLLARGVVYAVMGEVALARQSYETAHTCLAELPDSPTTCEQRALACRGMGELLQYDAPNEALEWLQRGLQAVVGLRSTEEAALRIRLGRILAYLGRNAEAQTELQNGLEQLPPGPSRLRLSALGNLGNIACVLGETERGLAYYRQVEAIARQLNDYWAMVEVRINLGIELDIAGRWSEALEHYEQALAQAERLGAVRQQARVALSMGNTQVKLGNALEAERHLRLCLALARDKGLKDQQVYALVSLANLFAHSQRPAEVEPILAEAEPLALELTLLETLPELYRARALTRLADGATREAVESAEFALKAAHDIQAEFEVGLSWRVLGQAQWANGQRDEAVAAFEQSLALLAGRDPYETARTQVVWGHVLTASGGAERGEHLLAEARATFERLGAKRDLELLNR